MRRLSLLAALLALALAAAADLAWGQASVPLDLRTDYSKGKIVAVPADIPHNKGAMVDSRLVPDLEYLSERFHIYVVEGWAGPLPQGGHTGCVSCHVSHSDHLNGMAVDLVPARWDGRGCDRSWKPISNLAHWAEPKQNYPRLPFRWVGYNGDVDHGCGNHLHLSWTHAVAPKFKIVRWVELFDPPAQTPVPPVATGSTGSVSSPVPAKALRRARLGD